jgi:hypothetical protein
MAYVQVEADDVRVSTILLLLLTHSRPQQQLEEGPEALQFKCAFRCVH